MQYVKKGGYPMFKRNVYLTTLIVVALLAAVVLSACAGAAPKQHTLKFFVKPTVPEKDHQREDTGAPDISVGDRRSGSRDVFDESDKKVGQLDTVKVVTDPADDPDEAHDQMLTMIVLSLEDGSTIVGLGLHLSEPGAGQPPKPDVINERAIVGGTGKYVGASGVWTAQRADDGTWTYTFTFTTPQ
jgi:hypothetical protein